MQPPSDDLPLQFKVPAKAAGGRLDRVLEELVPSRTRAALQKLVRRGQVRLNGQKVLRSNVRVAAGSTLEIRSERPPQRPKLADQPPPPDPELLHEDAEILVVHKPTGLLTHPADRSPGPSLAEWAEQLFGPLPAPAGRHRPGIVHRLDRETSGVLVLGRTREAFLDLKDQFRARTIRKEYLAWCVGCPPRDAFESAEPLGPVSGHPDRQQVSKRGKEASTEFRVLARGPFGAELSCRPRTGRRHQIRVHLADLGWPIVGDKLYGAETPEELALGMARQALHAYRITLRHPGTGAEMEFCAPVPKDLERLRQTWVGKP